MTTTNGKYLWSSMKLTQPFRNGLLSNYYNRKTFEVIPLTYPLESVCLFAIVLTVLQLTASDYHFCTFDLFNIMLNNNKISGIYILTNPVIYK
jgi:hypothetical protein